MQFPYLVWLTLFVFIPIVILWSSFYDVLSRYAYTFSRCIIGAVIVGTLWDIAAVQLRIWGFPEGCCVTPRAGILPWEEYMFIIFVTIYMVSITLILRERFNRHRQHRRARR